MPNRRLPDPLSGALILAAALATEAGAQRLSFFPDTVFPGRRHVAEDGFLPLAIKKAAGAANDTVILRNGATTFEAEGMLLTWGGRTYTFTVPLRAAVGSYDAFSKQGTRLDSHVTYVPDVAAMPRELSRFDRVKGLRGASYLLSLETRGLALGWIPAAGPFVPDVQGIFLVSGSRRIGLSEVQVIDPYAATGRLALPMDAPLGPWRVEVTRAGAPTLSREGLFTVWEPPLPVIQAVRPDSLVAVRGGELTLTGVNMEYGVKQGSMTALDRGIVKEIHLRREGQIVPATHYPAYYPVVGGGMRASFAPMETPLGSYDVGLVLHGRTDTAYLRDGLRLVSRPEPRITQVVPATTGRWDYRAAITVDADFMDDAVFRMRQGNRTIPGRIEAASGQTYHLAFPLDTGVALGAYDLEVTGGGRTLIANEAVQVNLPSIRLTSGVLTAGGWGRLSFEFADLHFNQYEIDRMSLRVCRAGTCVAELDKTDMAAKVFDAGGEFNLPPGAATGLYDLVVEIRDPVSLTLRKADGILVVPPATRGLVPADAAYHTAKADTLLRIDAMQVPDICGSMTLRIASAPAGMTLADGFLQWRPGAADTGLHYVSLVSPSDSICQDGRFAAIRVVKESATALPGRGEIRPGLSDTRTGKEVDILGRTGARIRRGIFRAFR